MGCSVRLALVLSFLALAPPLVAQPAPRRPQGIYAVVNVQENIKKEQAANASVTPAELKAYFINLYQDLLGNSAVAGLALWVNWNALNPNSPGTADAYDWTYLDDAFNQASAWNTRNPTQAPGAQVAHTGFAPGPFIVARRDRIGADNTQPELACGE